MRANRLRRVVGKIFATVAEMNEAAQRLAMLRAAPDRYLLRPDEPPATYDEFITRTSGPLWHEPPASRRVPGGLPR